MLAATGLVLLVAQYRSSLSSALTWTVISVAVIAVGAYAFRLITRGSGGDLGLCERVPWLRGTAWVLLIGGGGYAVQALTTSTAWPDVDTALGRVADTGADLQPAALAVAFAPVAVTSVAAAFVCLGMVHRGIRDASMSLTGHWAAVTLGVIAQLLVLLLTDFVHPGQLAAAAYSVTTASLAYEFTGALWVPAVGVALHGTLYVALSELLAPQELSVSALALVAVPVTALLLVSWVGKALGTRHRIATV